MRTDDVGYATLRASNRAERSWFLHFSGTEPYSPRLMLLEQDGWKELSSQDFFCGNGSDDLNTWVELKPKADLDLSFFAPLGYRKFGQGVRFGVRVGREKSEGHEQTVWTEPVPAYGD